MSNPYAWADPVQPDGRIWESIYTWQADADRHAAEAAEAEKKAAESQAPADVPADETAAQSPAEAGPVAGDQVSPPADESKED